MPPGKCIFNERWLKQTEYASWLERNADKYRARFKLCMKTFEISNIGEPAIRSHKKEPSTVSLFIVQKPSLFDETVSQIWQRKKQVCWFVEKSRLELCRLQTIEILLLRIGHFKAYELATFLSFVGIGKEYGDPMFAAGPLCRCSLRIRTFIIELTSLYHVFSPSLYYYHEIP